MNTYVAQGDKIYVRDANDRLELFIQIYRTTDCTRTPEQQATIIAQMLNGE